VARNILYEGYQGIRLPKEVQRKRVMEVIRRELTDRQRETLLAYYIEELNIIQIAQRRGVHKSTVSRTLKRAEAKLRRYLRY
jgi:RNA polymerase sigma-70 factor (ECF subfamily)